MRRHELHDPPAAMTSFDPMRITGDLLGATATTPFPPDVGIDGVTLSHTSA